MRYSDLQALVPRGSVPDWAALLDLIPDLRALAATPQDSVYHAEGDVWTHTKMVCEELQLLPDYAGADEVGRFVAFYAALLHDISKPACTVIHPDGGISSAGHSRRGEVDVRIMLWKAGVPFAFRERICRVISVHQLPFFAFRDNRAGHTPEFMINKLSCEQNLRELCLVAEADMRGRISVARQAALDDIELFRLMAKEQGCYDTPRAFPDDHTRFTYFKSEGAISPDYRFHQEPGSKAILMCGLPASGKNTWVSDNVPDLPVVSYDDAREELGIEHGDNPGQATQLVLERAREQLRVRAPFVWNATHLSRQMRGKSLKLLQDYNADVTIVYVEQPEATLRGRNRKRDGTLTDAGIDKMLYRWEIPLATEAHHLQLVIEDAAAPARTRSRA